MVYGAPLNTHCTALDGRRECGFRTPCALADELEAAEGGTASIASRWFGLGDNPNT